VSILSFAFIFIACPIHFRLQACLQGREAPAGRADRACFRAFALGYVFLAAFIAAY